MKMLNIVGRGNSSRFPHNLPQNVKSKETCKQQNRPDSSFFCFHTRHRSKARLRAEEEEEKLIQEQIERAEKLQKFQADVQKRVSAIRKMKQQKEIERGMKDMNIACNVMRSCVGLSTSVINPQKFLISLKQPNSSFNEVPHSLSQNQEILTALSHDNNTKQQQLLEEKMPSTSSTSAIFDQESGPVKIICDDKQSPNVSYLITGGMKDKKKFNRVQDNTCPDYSKNHIVSMVQPDKTELQEVKKQQTLQRTLSRKVFMDLEREKTREVERQNRQRMELFLLRNTREAIRKEVETSAREPVIYSEAEMYQEYKIPESIKKPEDILPKHSLHKVSYTRKLLAMMQLLEEKCNKMCVPVPSLCPCGTYVADPLRNSCANNCQFYKNPAEYCRAIKCLISSMESSKDPRPFLT